MYGYLRLQIIVRELRDKVTKNTLFVQNILNKKYLFCNFLFHLRK